jgi:hypothetical protein
LLTYRDTSAVINAAVSLKVFARLDQGRHVTRLHTLGEFFATMTGRGVSAADQAGNLARIAFSPADCATWLREFSRKVTFEELDSSEVLNALDETQQLGIQGARIYDYWHALASKKAKADEIITRNMGHFVGLAPKVEWP